MVVNVYNTVSHGKVVLETLLILQPICGGETWFFNLYAVDKLFIAIQQQAPFE
jgi:hypothetical protein